MAFEDNVPAQASRKIMDLEEMDPGSIAIAQAALAVAWELRKLYAVAKVSAEAQVRQTARR